MLTIEYFNSVILKVPLHPNHVFFVFNMFLELIYENHGGFFHSTLLGST